VPWNFIVSARPHSNPLCPLFQRGNLLLRAGVNPSWKRGEGEILGGAVWGMMLLIFRTSH
jgi:hypothetical protein